MLACMAPWNCSLNLGLGEAGTAAGDRAVFHVLFFSPQCKMSLNGQRGECWCVNPNTGKLIQGAPTIRGDPECHFFYNEQQEARGVHSQRMQ